MRFRISEFWERSINRPGSLGVGVAVWAVMLGGVFATTQLNTTHIASDWSYVDHEPAVAASIRQKHIGLSTAADQVPTAETASVSMPQYPHSTAPEILAQNIPVPTPRPVPPAVRALPLLSTRDVPIPAIDRGRSCQEVCDQMAMNAFLTNEETSRMEFDESPVLEGPVEWDMPIVSNLKRIAAEAIRPLDLLKPLVQRY